MFSLDRSRRGNLAVQIADGLRTAIETGYYRAAGALQAMLLAGVRIPEDVAVVTWANRWEGPIFIKPLTRMEMDAIADGELLARGVLEFLSKGTFPESAEVGPSYIRGETF